MGGFPIHLKIKILFSHSHSWYCNSCVFFHSVNGVRISFIFHSCVDITPNAIGGIFIGDDVLILVFKCEVFISLLIDGSQFFHTFDHECGPGHHLELFAGDALPCRQSEEGVSALEVRGWAKTDSTSRLLDIYIVKWSVLFVNLAVCSKIDHLVLL